jgi:aerobic carbon-monoxide dehydrogenase small subunit
VKDLHQILLRVNGRAHELTVEARRTLADMLRHDLGYTGTHLGCEHGICGACTVLVDGSPVRSCLMFGVQTDGTEVSTVEGLSAGEDLSDLQQAFSDHHALQCGFCTPGFLMVAAGALEADPDLADKPDAVAGVVGSNICRCTGYEPVRRAVTRAARERRGDTP